MRQNSNNGSQIDYNVYVDVIQQRILHIQFKTKKIKFDLKYQECKVKYRWIPQYKT